MNKESIKITPKGRIIKIEEFNVDDTLLIKIGSDYYVINQLMPYDGIEITLISQGEEINQAGVLVGRNIIEWCKEHGTFNAIIDKEIVKYEGNK